MPVKHNFNCAIADATTPGIVKPSHWNDNHALTLPEAIIIGGNTAGLTASISSGTILFAGGNNITLSTGANAFSIHGAAGGGGGFTKSIKLLNEDFIGFGSGSGTSSQGTQYFFSPFHMDAPMSMSHIWLYNSFSMASATSSNSSGRQSFSYSIGVNLFRRVDYGANSESLTWYTSGSWGISMSRSHTSNNNSVSLAWVTDSTGGTSSWSTASAGAGYTTLWSGPRLMAIPMVTSLAQGEWFLALRHSSTSATVGSNAIVLSVNRFQWSLQTGIGYMLPILYTNSTRSNPFHGIGFGSASAITTNAAMPASVISAGGALQMPHGALVNMGVS